jgi:hypothetical protein
MSVGAGAQLRSYSRSGATPHKSHALRGPLGVDTTEKATPLFDMKYRSVR